MKNTFKLSTIILLALPVLTACPQEDPGYVETRTEAEVVEALARQALSEVGVGYSKFTSDGLALGNNNLVASVNKKVYEGDEKGLNFSFAYTLTPDEEYNKDYVTLDTTANKLVAEIVTEKDLTTDTTKALGGLTYTLKATISFAGYTEGFEVKGLETTADYKFTLEEEWNIINKSCISGSIADVKTISKNGDRVSFKGQVAAWISDKYDDMYTGVFVADGADGVQLYAGKITQYFFENEVSKDESGNEIKDENGKAVHALKINPGAYVEVYGSVSIYNGLYEVKPQQITVLENAADYADISPAVVSTITADQVAGIKTSTTGNLVKVEHLKLKEGFNIDKTMKDGAHWTIECVDADGKQVNLYANYHMGDAAQAKIKTLLKGLTAGQTFTVYGATSMGGTTKPNVQLVGSADRAVGDSIVLDA